MNINETIAATYADFYIKHTPEETFDFVFKTSFAIQVLNSLYAKFVSEGVEPIEKIPITKKEKYWEIACKYYTELPTRLQASRAIYTLELITSNF